MSRDVMQRLRVFADMAGGSMFSRLRQKAHIWAVSWQDDIYTDADNEARLRAAVETLAYAVTRSRSEDATMAERGEPWKRAADVANQAFMLADPQRRERDYSGSKSTSLNAPTSPTGTRSWFAHRQDLDAERARTVVLTEALGWATADAHVGWLLYESQRRPPKHAKELADCTVEACVKRRTLLETVLPDDRVGVEPLDLAWAAVERVLPDGWDLMVGHTTECQFCEGWWATASKRLARPPYYPKIISSEDGRPRGEHHDPTPAAALQALAARLIESPTEGETP